MAFFNSYICPQCKTQFPFFIRPSMRINRGLLAPYLKCPNCGQVCRQKIVVISALWIWPLTLCFYIAVVYTLRTFLNYKELPILYILVAIVSLFPLFIGYRRGFKLIRVEEDGARQSKSQKWLIPAAGLTLFFLLFGYYTHDWVNVVIGVIINLIVWAVFYHFSGDKKDN
jgi:DNA-directed RNA polymerase subunit RPC12/RpoP